MKKTVMILLLILTLPIVFSYSKIIAYDDFNREDNQNISENYNGGFKYYESPIFEADTIMNYNGEDEVMIKDRQLYIEEEDYCDYTSVPIYFGHLINLTSFDQGNISFTWTNYAIGESDRWIVHLLFGKNIHNTEAVTKSCFGQGPIKQWSPLLYGGPDKGILFRSHVDFKLDGPDILTLGSGACEYVKEPIFGIGSGNDQKFTFSFDIETNTTKILIQDDKIYEIKCNLDHVDLINSLAFQVQTNQGDVTPVAIVDDLTLTINVPEEPQTRLEKFSPVIYLHSEETYELKEVEAMLYLSDLYEKNTKIISNPLTQEDLDVVEKQHNYLDLINVDITNMFDLPHPNDFSQFKPTVYGTETIDENDYKHLQYFIFYPFQDWLNMNHEGDWEMVQVTLNDIGEIESVAYDFNMFTMTYYDIDEVELFNETHPVVLVGKGSHNNYASKEPIKIPKVLEKLEFFYNLLNGFKKIDKIDRLGKQFLPKGFETIQNQENYELVEINSATSLVDYEGHWGQKAISQLKTGPRGPKYNPRFARRWRHPERYTYAPNIPFISAFLYSPLNIEVQDSSGIVEDYLFYAEQDNESEVILIEGNNYTLYLNAYDRGQFSFEVYYYDNETDTGLMVRYDNITNTEKSRAMLDINKISDFILYLDYKGNNRYELTYFPDEYVVLGEFILPDLDEDNINNFDDNCPFVYNPNQEDFNEDGFGDLCDNPRHYKERALEKINQEIKNKPTKTLYIAKKHIQKSLDEKYWKNKFEVRRLSVFMKEFVAARMLKQYPEIQRDLAYADKLIIENSRDNFDQPNVLKKKLNLADTFFEKGNQAFEDERYVNAILYYMRVWIVNRY